MQRSVARGALGLARFTQVTLRFFRHLAYVGATVPRLMGRFPRHCNVCSHHGRFYAFGQPPRFDAMCPNCGSLERQRLLKLWIDREHATLRGRRMLHFAPEVGLVDHLKAISENYLSADLDPARADAVINIEDMALPSESFDLLICVHVVEHVDDRRAFAEMHRVLAPGGIALIMTPVIEGWENTFEDDGIVSHKERALRYGQPDHRRYYGRDIRQRFADTGFHVEEFPALEPDVGTYGLNRADTLFICRKKASSVVVRMPERATASGHVSRPQDLPELQALPAE